MNKGVLDGLTVAAFVPPGVVWEYAGNTLPDPAAWGIWLWADGTAYPRSQYPDLFSAIGVLHGAGNGTTTFNVPNRMGRVGVGRDGSTEFLNVGQIGGSKTTTATHTHTTSTGGPNANATSWLTANTGGNDGATWWVSSDHTHSATSGWMATNASNHTHFYDQPNRQNIGLSPGASQYALNPLGNQTGAGYVDHQHGLTTGGISANHNHAMNNHGHDMGHNHDLSNHTHSGTSGDSSATAAAGNLVPYVVMNYIIKAA